jgi:hypothetical protein
VAIIRRTKALRLERFGFPQQLELLMAMPVKQKEEAAN